MTGPKQRAKPYPIEHKRWLSRDEAAGYLGICPDQFDKTIRPMIAESIHAGRPRFDLMDIDRAMESGKRGLQA